jgi:hypothetical protein
MRIPSLRAGSIGAAILVPALAVASALALPSGDASAKPEYAAREKRDCSYCHVNPKGSGPRNAKGIEYQKNGFKFLAEVKRFGEDSAFKTEANARAFEYVRAAIQLEHWAYALKKIAELKGKEDKKGPGYPKLTAAESTIDGRGRDLLKAAQEAIQGGKVADAAAAIARVEAEFKGRDPSKDVGKWRTELIKLPGGKEANAKAVADEPLRVALLDAKMKSIEGDNTAAIKLLEDLIAKSPEGPVAPEAKTKLDELKKTSGTEPAMGG